MITIDRKAAKKRVEEAEQVPIFQLDDENGEPVIYSIPKVQRAELSLNYIDLVAERGDDVATAWLLIEMFGRPAFDALRGVEGLSDDDLSAVRDAVIKIVMPAANPKGPRR